MTNEKKVYKTKIFKVQELKQVKTTTSTPRFAIKTPSDVKDFLINEIGNSDREKFVVLFLNTKSVVIGYEIAFIGSINACIVHPRETFKAAILNNAASIIVSHCHPSGSVVPSDEDYQITTRLQESGKILGIELLDHIIVGGENYISLREKGYM